MKATTNISRADILRFNVVSLLNEKGNYLTLLFFVAVFFAMSVWKHGVPEYLCVWFSFFVNSVISALVVVIVLFAFCVGIALLTASKAGGRLGKHDYVISPDGFFERTVANESLWKWTGVTKVKRLKSFLLVQVSSYELHIIPESSFNTTEQFQQFFSTSLDYWNTARRAAPETGAVE